MRGKDVTRYNEDIDFSDVDTQFVWIPSSSGYPVRLDSNFCLDPYSSICLF